jgi:hypothetical protein
MLSMLGGLYSPYPNRDTVLYSHRRNPFSASITSMEVSR